VLKLSFQIPVLLFHGFGASNLVGAVCFADFEDPQNLQMIECGRSLGVLNEAV